MNTIRLVSRLRGPLLSVLLFLGMAGSAFAASTPDPCTSLNYRSSVVVNQSTATTTQLVALNANHSIFVCGFAITIAGSASTAATAAFESGTGSNCASNVTTLTGTFGSGDAAAGTTPTQVTYGTGSHTIFTAAPGTELCIVTAGNAVDTQGILTYVQSTGTAGP